MPYKINWYVEDRVLRLQVFGETTPQDLTDSTTEVIEIIQQYTSPLIFMLDFRELEKISFSVAALKLLTQFRPRELPIAWIVIVSDNPVHSFFGTVSAKVTGFPAAIFKTLEEANAFIAHNAPDIVPPAVSSEAI